MSGTPHIVDRRVVAELKWLRLVELTWADAKGTQRAWESCERTTAASAAGGVESVEMCVVRKGGSDGTRVLLVTQYRPPVGEASVEWPAGLVDEGETPAEAAIRELLEETGYYGVVVSTSAPCSNDPGMSNSRMCFVRMTVDMADPRNQHPVAHQDEGEDITSEWVAVESLTSHLEACAARGLNVDGKVYSFAAGAAMVM